MKLIFAGTPEFSGVILNALLSSQHKIVAVYTQPDKPSGRGQKLTESAVKKIALAHDLPIEQPATLKDPAVLATLKEYQADKMIVVAYGLLLPQTVLDIRSCWNVHASLLPKWRGAAPIQRAIAAGDTETGITIMQMDAGLDTGDILLTASIPISNADTSASLFHSLAELGANTLLRALDQINTLTPIHQDNTQASYAHKIKKEESLIDWNQPALVIQRKIRAFTPWPGIHCSAFKIITATVAEKNFTTTPGTLVQIERDCLRVATKEGALDITQLQYPNGKIISVRDALNANPSAFSLGMVL